MVNDDYDDNDDDCDYHDNDNDNDDDDYDYDYDDRPELVEPTPAGVPCTRPPSTFGFNIFLVYFLFFYFE